MNFTSIQWQGDAGKPLTLLDQTLLPEQTRYIQPETASDVAEAIHSLRVRGAPAIGIAAAYGLVIAARAGNPENPDGAITEAAELLKNARPTAVNLAWAIDRCLQNWRQHRNLETLEREAVAIHDEDRALCRAIGEAGLPLIAPGDGVLTHCNAGALAVSELGTALAPMYLAHEAGISFRVFVDETRPLLQGSRLTAWELTHAGIDATLICDNMAATHMQSGAISKVITGTDRVTANGDVVNKIGTLGVAILAHHFGIPFYVALPSSTFDAATADGQRVTIEQRNADEVRKLAGQSIAPADVGVANPAFDVTPHELVTAFITDRGVIEPPFAENLASALRLES